MPRAKNPRNGNSKTRPVGVLQTAPAVQESLIAKADNLESEIRRRAYELWERRGCTDGHEKEDWLVAEQEVVTRHQQGA